MYRYRITKYNPEFRNAEGCYLKDEWYLFSQVGKIFENRTLTMEDYLKVEDTYIKAILLFMDCLNVSSLFVNGLEQNTPPNYRLLESLNSVNLYNSLKEGMALNKESIEIVVRLILRNQMWCKFNSSEMFIRFGWDYYMYIGSKKICRSSIEKIEKAGLFVEKHTSRYY